MTKIQWVLDIQEILIKKEMYEISASFRDAAKYLSQMGEENDLFSSKFFEEMIEKVTYNLIFLYKSDITKGQMDIIVEYSRPYLRDDKINQINDL